MCWRDGGKCGFVGQPIPPRRFCRLFNPELCGKPQLRSLGSVPAALSQRRLTRLPPPHRVLHFFRVPPPLAWRAVSCPHFAAKAPSRVLGWCRSTWRARKAAADKPRGSNFGAALSKTKRAPRKFEPLRNAHQRGVQPAVLQPTHPTIPAPPVAVAHVGRAAVGFGARRRARFGLAADGQRGRRRVAGRHLEVGGSGVVVFGGRSAVKKKVTGRKGPLRDNKRRESVKRRVDALDKPDL